MFRLVDGIIRSPKTQSGECDLSDIWSKNHLINFVVGLNTVVC